MDFYQQQNEKQFNKLMVYARLMGGLNYLVSDDNLKDVKSVQELAVNIKSELALTDEKIQELNAS